MRIQPAPPEVHDEFYDAAGRFWLPVARSVDVPIGGRLASRLLGEDLVVWRDYHGQVTVLDNLCLHRGTMLSDGEVTGSGNLACPYHGWEYGSDGACVRIPQLPPETKIPSKARVGAHPVREQNGLIWTRLASSGEAEADVPPCPNFGEAAWTFHVGTPSDWHCQATRMVENFLDVAHFGYIHADTFGNPDVSSVVPTSVRTSPDMLHIDAKVPYLARDPWGKPPEGQDFAVVDVEYDYHYDVPFTAWIRGVTKGDEYILFVSAAPRTVAETTVFWAFGVPDSLQVSADEIERRENAVFSPDRFIVEGQRPEWLPLDLAAELHMRFDSIGLNLRRSLNHHGFPVVSLLRA
ncbi:aromatic ring-hydroxylating dioxygenase subunit alpha [Nocardioides terrisoli]|uniref:aromatic ring-hydroxylating dioxygenase subunit alpha n=1 Tax=Nocardioides terrisoli TaxID=3388267 RepID=UPI00287BB7F3|nr:aromatic ring-hydroxylating dioxygenase subunit alpha [Nocardioides marmorisolisilvae]